MLPTTHHKQARVHEDKGARPPDAGRAVHHGGSHVLPEAPRLADGRQELEKGVGAGGDAKVGPGGVVVVQHLALLVGLCVGEPQRRDGVVLARYGAQVVHLVVVVLPGQAVPRLPGPVLVTLVGALLDDSIQHDDGLGVLKMWNENTVTETE